MEVCESCGLIIAKWEQKRLAEKERERNRKRQLREAQLKERAAADEERKKEELERLISREDELRKELGIKGQGKFLQLFERQPLFFSIVIFGLIILVTATLSQAYNRYLEDEARQVLLAQEATVQMTNLAPAMAAAASLQQTGNQQIISEMAEVAKVLRGQETGNAREVAEAATLMMKGVGSEEFLRLTAESQVTADSPMASSADQITPVNLGDDNTALTGIEEFSAGNLPSVPGFGSATEQIFDLFAMPDMIVADENNPDAPPMNAVDQLDGSELVTLLKFLHEDPEWSHFLQRQASILIQEDRVEDAEEIVMQIGNPAIKIGVFVELVRTMMRQDRPLDAKVYRARVNLELDRLENFEVKAKLISEMAGTLAAAGDKSQPGAAIGQIEEMIETSIGNYEKAIIESHLAIIHLHAGQIPQARSSFVRAVNSAGRIESMVDRLAAFCRIAQRYYDARNTTLANEILSEAARLAGKGFAAEESARVFAEIALAQGYIGDLNGAYISIRNTGGSKAQNQVLRRLAEYLIGTGEYYKAMQVRDKVVDPIVHTRLSLQLASALIGAENNAFARQVLDHVADQTQVIDDSMERSLLVSKMAKLFARLEYTEVSERHFHQALMLPLNGRKGDITKASIAMDQAHALMFPQSQRTIDLIQNPMVSEPVAAALVATRVLSTKFPVAPGG